MAKMRRMRRIRQRIQKKPRRPPSSVKPLVPGKPGHTDKFDDPRGQQLKNQPEARETQPIQALHPGQQPQPQLLGGTPVPPAQQTVGDVAGIGTQTVNPALPQPGQTAGAPQLTNPATGQPIPQPLMTMGSDIGGGNVKPASASDLGYRNEKHQKYYETKLGLKEGSQLPLNQARARVQDDAQFNLLKNPSFSRDGFGKTPREKESTYMQRVAGKGKFGHGFGKQAPKKPPTREQQFTNAMKIRPRETNLAAFNEQRRREGERRGVTVAHAVRVPTVAEHRAAEAARRKALFNNNRELADSLGIKWEEKS